MIRKNDYDLVWKRISALKYEIEKRLSWKKITEEFNEMRTEEQKNKSSF